MIQNQAMDHSEFSELYHEYAKSLLSYLTRLTGSAEVGNDLLQELFIALFEKFDRLKISNTRAYFFTMAYRLYVGWLRKEKKATQVDIDNIPLADNRSNFSDDLSWKFLRQKILVALREADPVLEQVFILKIDHNFKVSEIAEIVGKSERSVNRYIKKLLNIVEEKFEGDLLDLMAKE